jgi:predicted RNase H-like HicB family nuclease
MKLMISLHKDESGWWVAECLNLPGCVTQAETRPAALERIREAAAAWIAVMREEHPDQLNLPLDIELELLELAA